MEKMAITIAKECNFRFIRQLLPFGESQALLFCPSPTEASLAVNKDFIPVAANTICLNRYHQLVNTIDTLCAL